MIPWVWGQEEELTTVMRELFGGDSSLRKKKKYLDCEIVAQMQKFSNLSNYMLKCTNVMKYKLHLNNNAKRKKGKP